MASMHRRRVSYYITFLVLFLYFVTCSAMNITLPQCENPSSCGNILNISYPFRLKGDPQNCGDPNYELSCENNTTVLYLYSGKYYVQAINRNNNTIRVADAGVQKNNCSSLPLRSFLFDVFSYYTPYSYYYYYPFYYHSSEIIFVSCENPVNSSLYVNTSPCVNGVYTSKSSFPSLRKHSYVLLVDAYAEVSVVEDACSIDMIFMSSSPTICKRGNCSYLDIHKELVYGFEVSWSDIYCKQCNGSGYCRINQDYTEVLGCSYDDYPCGFLCHVIAIAKSYLPYCEKFLYTVGSYDLGTVGYPSNNFERFYIVKLLGAYLLMAVIALWAARALCGTPCVIAFVIYKWRRRHLSMYDTIEEFLQSNNNLMPIRYSYSDIRKMTKAFQDKLGEGGYGTVYKGKLRSGRHVAIKMLGKSKAKGQDFISEVATIGRIHHVNVVRLAGFCVEGPNRALVYEFMPNGSLDKYIFSREGYASLSWEKLYEISLGVARGIEYLHRGCDMQILHFDIKPHNILLDENFTPKISDFGLAKLYPTNDSIVSLTAARGTIGYMAPELFYKNIGGISYKADVYSFGMLLMEMAGRRKNLNAFAEHLSQIYFPSWAYDQFNHGKDIDIGDATEEERKSIKKMIIVALWCIQMKPSDRPSMNRVVEMLEGEVGSLQMPPKPFLCPQEMQEENPGINTNPARLPNPPSDSIDSTSTLVVNVN